MPVHKCIQHAVDSSGGLLQMDAGALQEEFFSISGGMFIPGPKHLLDNLIDDIVGKLQHFESFQRSLKVVCVAELTTEQLH